MFEIKPLSNGCSLIVPQNCLYDMRGNFIENFNSDLNFEIQQINSALSYFDTFRGLHFQTNQSRIFRVVYGSAKVFAFNPFTYKMAIADLDGVSSNMLYAPKGFGWGYIVKSEIAVIEYWCDTPYDESLRYKRSSSTLEQFFSDSTIMSSSDKEAPCIEES